MTFRFKLRPELTPPRWNSANVLTMLGDFAAVDQTVKSQVVPILENSFIEAQKINLAISKVIMPNFIMLSFNGTAVPNGVVPTVAANPIGFLNGFYDDEGWWALNWVQAYDITKDNDYLVTAMDIFEDMKNSSPTPCGGIWWDKAQTYVNAIANELYLSLGAHLANRASNKAYYLNLAEEQLDFFTMSGMVNSKNTINDGLDLSTCENNGGTVWTYNQGVILGALVELQRASPNSSYLTMANTLATAAISALSTNNVLKESCEPNCGADGNQFKGIFMRNLMRLQQVSPNSKYLTFIKANADSIWSSDRNAAGELSVQWAGPFINPANASSHSSAMDALVAATAFDADGIGS